MTPKSEGESGFPAPHFGTMDERSSKRARQQRDGGGGGGGLQANGFGAGFPRTSLAGCHLSVDTCQKHLFLGVPIDLNVSLLNDEDVVQHVTQDIHVSITGEDGKVVGTNSNAFELTPQHPAILDGTSTFQLRLWPGCVRAGNRVKVHVEAASGRGGEQIQADSEPIMVCRSALHVVTPPPDNWYKDEGGKNNCIAIDVMVREKSPGHSGGQVQAGVPLGLVLVYENGTEVHSQNILQMQADTQLVTNEQGRANLKFKITEVSQRHQSQRFCIKIGPDIRMSPEHSDVAPVVTVPIMVLSKRKNRRIKAEKQAQQNAAAYSTPQPGGGLNSLIWATANGQLPQPGMDGIAHRWPSNPSAILSPPPAGRGHMGTSPPPAHQQQHQQQRTPQGPAAAVPALGAPSGAPANPAPVSAPVEEPALRVPPGSTGALQKVFRWTDAVLQLLQMELQWEHIGYEREPDGTASYARPLFRCPLCRVCKGGALPHQKHAPDCKLRGLLDEFSGQRSNDCAAVIHEQQQQRRGNSSSSPPVAPPIGGLGARSGGGGGVRDGEGIMGTSRVETGLQRGPVSAIVGLKSQATDAAPGRGEEANVVSSAGLRIPSHAHFLQNMQSHELLSRGGSAGLSIGLSAMLDGNMGPSSSGGDNGGARVEGRGSLARTGSVAPFVPQRSDLTPAEEKAHFIMLPTTTPDGAGEGGGRSSSGSKQLTVFSENKTLLGFYEEKYDVGTQTHLPFQEFDGNFSPSAKRALEAALQASLDEDSGRKANGGGAMDADNAADSSALSKKRSRPTRSTSAAAAAEVGVKRESSDCKRDPAAGGVRKVYKLADFQGYQEMKEQVFYDWLAGVGQAIPENVFEPEKTDGKGFAKTSLR